MDTVIYFSLFPVLKDVALSLQRVAVGVGLATLLGVPLGLLRSSLPLNIKQNRLIKFFLEAPKFPPPIAWIPFVILALGIGEKAAYAIVFIGAFSPIFTSSFEGAESTPLVWKQTAASLQLNLWQKIFKITYKSALPHIFVGLRSGISMGWMSVVAAEMISGQSGLGYSIQLHRLNLQYDLMVLDMVLIGLIGFLLFEAVVFLEQLFIPWHERARTRGR